MIERLKAENLPLHGQLVAEKSAHARALLNNVRLQWHMKKVVKEKEEPAGLPTSEQAKWENSTVVKELMEDVWKVTMNAGNLIGTLAAWLEQAQQEVDELKKEKTTNTQGLAELREGRECAEY